MKALKTIGILLVLLIVLALIASLILPKNMNVERSITINAPADVVWKHISSHEAFDAWSPWNKLDSNMTKEIIGEDGTVGAIWKWTSEHKQVGNGEQEFTILNRDSGMVETELRFEGMGTSKSYRNMSEGDDGVTVTWGFNNDNIGIPTNLFMFVFGVEKQMNKQFDQGLNDLKEICENDKPTGPEKPEKEYDVSEASFPATNYLGKKQIVKWADMKAHFETHMPAMAGLAKEAMAGAPSALYYSWDEENEQAEMTAAIPVAGSEAMGDYDLISVDSSKCLQIDYFGAYEGGEAAHIWMNYYIATNGYEMTSPVIEQYMNDPMEETDTAKWHTRIIYLVK